MNPILSLHMDNCLVSPALLAVPDMSLSSARTAMKRHSFLLVLDTNRMIEFLTPAYAAWVEESKRDDEISGGPQDDLAFAGYPELSSLVGNPGLLRIVLGYLQKDFLERLTWDGTGEIAYWYDDVTGCDFVDQRVLLSGVCYSKELD